jgi:hypothetical protein
LIITQLEGHFDSGTANYTTSTGRSCWLYLGYGLNVVLHAVDGFDGHCRPAPVLFLLRWCVGTLKLFLQLAREQEMRQIKIAI